LIDFDYIALLIYERPTVSTNKEVSLYHIF